LEQAFRLRRGELAAAIREEEDAPLLPTGGGELPLPKRRRLSSFQDCFCRAGFALPPAPTEGTRQGTPKKAATPQQTILHPKAELAAAVVPPPQVVQASQSTDKKKEAPKQREKENKPENKKPVFSPSDWFSDKNLREQLLMQSTVSPSAIFEPRLSPVDTAEIFKKVRVQQARPVRPPAVNP